MRLTWIRLNSVHSIQSHSFTRPLQLSARLASRSSPRELLSGDPSNANENANRLIKRAVRGTPKMKFSETLKSCNQRGSRKLLWQIVDRTIVRRTANSVAQLVEIGRADLDKLKITIEDYALTSWTVATLDRAHLISGSAFWAVRIVGDLAQVTSSLSLVADHVMQFACSHFRSLGTERNRDL